MLGGFIDEELKVVVNLLVGDTCVGKSGLAKRSVHKQFVSTKSSHAPKAYTLESNIGKETSGITLHQETVLW